MALELSANQALLQREHSRAIRLKRCFLDNQTGLEDESLSVMDKRLSIS